MKQTVTEYDFLEAFKRMNRQENFSHGGLCALYSYLTDYEEDTGEEIELDVIALCCEFSEYENFTELQQDYSDVPDMETLQENTTVIPIPESEGFIIQAY